VSDFDYVTVGHVTLDVIEDSGERRPGGGAFYSALQAARLGLRTLILTKGRPQELEELLRPYREELQLRVLRAEQTTTFATSGTGAERRQRVLAWAGPIAEPIEVDTAILHFAPIARETPNRWQGRAKFVGVTPQGLMRTWDGSGEMSLLPLNPDDLPERFDALVVSHREHPFCAGATAAGAITASAITASAIPASAIAAGVLAVTAGSSPTTVVLPDGTAAQVPTPAVEQPRDDLGAGDVFAAAFFIALHNGSTAIEAAAYGNAAAAVRVAGTGPQAIGNAAAIIRAQRR
jgi:sugar/nucleoside kinase (ribokinase family)